MTAAIKRMIAERRRLAEQAQRMDKIRCNKQVDVRFQDETVARMYERVDAAAPYIDAGWKAAEQPGGWPPSFKLKAIYWVTFSSDWATEERLDAALAWIDELLDVARERFKLGVHPEPFRENPFADPWRAEPGRSE